MAEPSSNQAKIGDGVAWLDLVRLSPLMARASGRPEIAIGLIDGPIVIDHPDLAAENIQEVPDKLSGTCVAAGSAACTHGTFVAGILLAKRGSVAPAICPGCTLLVRPIFPETAANGGLLPSATAEELAEAMADVIRAGARIVNLSAAVLSSSSRGERSLEQVIDHALRRGVLIVAAAGNQGILGSSLVTRHPWVIPVVAYDFQRRPMVSSNLGGSIGRHGLGGPGEGVTSLGATGEPRTLEGTSVATPFITGAVALIWSEFRDAPAATVRSAVTQAVWPRKIAIIPPLLDAWSSYQKMSQGLAEQ
jgi:subtilisin family serine protease